MLSVGKSKKKIKNSAPTCYYFYKIVLRLKFNKDHKLKWTKLEFWIFSSVQFFREKNDVNHNNIFSLQGPWDREVFQPKGSFRLISSFYKFLRFMIDPKWDMIFDVQLVKPQKSIFSFNYIEHRDKNYEKYCRRWEGG